MALTIRDIAKIAGVSPTTVSFAINGKGNISEETRKHVQKIIEQTGFRPSINSRRLSAQKSFNICVAFDVGSSLFTDLFYVGVTRGAQQAARALGYNIVLSDFTSGIPDIILNRDTDGVIFFQDLERELFDTVRNLSVPFVVADSHISQAPYPTVGVNHHLASYAAVKYLLAMGHREIAFLGPSTYTHLFDSAHKGYTQAMLEYNLIPRQEFTIASEETSSGAAERVLCLLELDPRPTAVFCSGDRLAVGAMLRTQEEGLRVPEDISFISIDDTMLCRYVRPMLSTVHIDMEELGLQAMRLLKQAIDGKPSENLVLTMDHVVERNSVKLLR